jgi:hypothetical protein
MSKSNTKAINEDKLDTNVKGKITKLTKKSGLHFNVNNCRSALVTYCTNQDMKKPKFKGAHVVVTSIIQNLNEYILEEVGRQTNKSKDGLYHITRPCLINTFALDDNLKVLYNRFNSKFDRQFDYNGLFMFSTSEMKTFEDVVLGKDYKLSNPARNFLCYYLASVFSSIAEVSLHFLLKAKKKTLDYVSIQFGMWVLLRESPGLYGTLETKMLATAKLADILKDNVSDESATNTKEVEDDDNDDDDDDDDDDNDDDDNDDGDVNDNDESDDSDNSDDDNTVIVKPVHRKPKQSLR